VRPVNLSVRPGKQSREIMAGRTEGERVVSLGGRGRGGGACGALRAASSLAPLEKRLVACMYVVKSMLWSGVTLTSWSRPVEGGTLPTSVAFTTRDLQASMKPRFFGFWFFFIISFRGKLLLPICARDTGEVTGNGYASPPPILVE
jgi:hypothetical protein